MADLKLLWVAVGTAGSDGSSRTPFEGLFDIVPIDPTALEASGPAEHWDAICFDFDYRNISGLKLIAQAKTRWPTAPLLILTLQGSSEVVIWALPSRPFDRLVKPVSA